MSGELGLVSSFRERVAEPLAAYRGGPRTAGRETRLLDFMQKRALGDGKKPTGMKAANGAELTMDHIWRDLGLDPAATTLGNVLTLSGDIAYFGAELVREAILDGFEMESSHLDLCAGQEPATALDVTTPDVEIQDARPARVREGETMPIATARWGSKTVHINEYARGLECSDHVVLGCTVPLLNMYFRRFGIELAAQLYIDGVLTMINGDQADGSDCAAVIGTENGTGTAFDDFLRAWARARRMGVRWDNLINNETTARLVLKLEEFWKQQGLGGEMVTLTSKNRIVPRQMNHFVSGKLSDDDSLLFDQRQTMVYLQFRGLLVETDRIIMRRINGTACSIMGGFGNLFRFARIIIRGSEAYGGEFVFPSWMKPLDDD